MKYRYWKKLIFLTFFISLSALLLECKMSESAVENKSSGQERGLLWKIESKDNKVSSYLFGTIHMIPVDDYFLPDGTTSAFEGAEKIFFEIDMSELEDPAKQMGLFQKAIMKDDISLSDLLKEEEYEMVKSHFESMGLPFLMFDRIKPMFLTVFADESMRPDAMNDGNWKFYEMEFMKMAKELNKCVGGLESIDFQMSMMDSIPYTEQAQMLVESIQSEKDGNSQMDTLISLYVDQQIGKLYQSFEADTLAVYNDLLLVNRNRSWIPIMVENMNKSSCFFAVGAAHLGGPDGVIRLLEQKGYTLKPLLSE